MFGNLLYWSNLLLDSYLQSLGILSDEQLQSMWLWDAFHTTSSLLVKEFPPAQTRPAENNVEVEEVVEESHETEEEDLDEPPQSM